MVIGSTTGGLINSKIGYHSFMAWAGAGVSGYPISHLSVKKPGPKANAEGSETNIGDIKE